VKEYNEAISRKIKEVEGKLAAKGLTPDQVQAKLEGLRKAQWQFRVNHSYAYNAANKQGEVGILEVKSTAHKGLKKLMADYITEYNQDPTSLESDVDENAGVWFNITKTGQMKNTEYTVSFNMVKEKSADGKVYKTEDRSPLAEAIVESYAQLGYDLNTIYLRKDYEDLKDILLYNIALLAKDYPEVALIPSFEVEIEESLAESAQAASVSLEEDEELEVLPKKPSSSGKVALKLDEPDDLEDDEEEVMAKPAKQQPVAKVKPKANFDVLAMADEILGD